MKTQKKSPAPESLARTLRVGLMGSPYDWGSLDFEEYKRKKIELTFTSFAGTVEANSQDILITATDQDDSTGQSCSLQQNEFAVLECEIGKDQIQAVSPDWIRSVFDSCIQNLNQAVFQKLLNHDDRYVGTESIIANYGTQVMRVGTLLGNSQIHIENEALACLIESPWRNEHELNYLISHMVFYLDGDVLRKPYVQKSVYEFGTSIRGVSNSSVAQNIIQTFTNDVIQQRDFQTASKLFEVQLDPFVIETAETRTKQSSRKKAA